MSAYNKLQSRLPSEPPHLAAQGVSANTQPVYRDFRAGDVRHKPGRHRQGPAPAGLRAHAPAG